MKLIAFSIYDEKAECFMQPFFQTTQGQAIRMFSDLVNDENSRIAKHPTDYKLYRMGSFNDTAGKLESEQEPIFVNHATDFREVKQ